MLYCTVLQVSHKHPLATATAQFIALAAYRVTRLQERPEVALTSAAHAVGDERVVQLLALVKRKVEEVQSSESPLGTLDLRELVDDSQGTLEAALSLSAAEQDVFTSGLQDELALVSMPYAMWTTKVEPWGTGKASPIEGALPGALYFILKYEGSLAQAVTMNAMVRMPLYTILLVSSPSTSSHHVIMSQS